MRRSFLILAFAALPFASPAQDSGQSDEDKGFITNFLEEKLSGAGRTITIDGFEGALSSRATFQQITIADTEGVWLTLKDGAIQWQRSALLRGRVDVKELAAAEIILPRLPKSEAAQPTAETTEFALPDLPVSIEIEKIMAGRVDIGEPVIGEAAVVSVDGNMSLDGGEGTADLTVNRVDGPRGQFLLKASYANDSKVLGLNLSLDEDSGGIVSHLLKVPDNPALKLQVTGEGPLSDYTADIALDTDGQPRVKGQLSLAAQQGSDGTDGHAFKAQLSGDVSVLMPPENRAFFGVKSDLLVQGWRGATGALSLPELSLDTDALDLSGSLQIAAGGAPRSANLKILLGQAAGASQVPSVLPVGGAQSTMLRTGTLNLVYDASKGDGWTLDAKLDDLERTGMKIGALTLSGAGKVLLDGTALESVNGTLNFGAEAIDTTDPAMAQAIGTSITGRTDFDMTKGNVLTLSKLDVSGQDYALTGDLTMDGLNSAMTVTAQLKAHHADLSRLGAATGRPLSGRVDGDLSGFLTILTGAFAVEAKLTGTDITAGQKQLDSMLSSRSQIYLDAQRGEDGIELSEFTINAKGLTAQANGWLNSNSSNLHAKIDMPDLSQADPDMSGTLQTEAFLSGASNFRQLTVSGEARDIVTGIADIDGLMKGATNLAIAAGQKGSGTFVVEKLRLANPQLVLDGSGDFSPGATDAALDVELTDLAALGRGWSGGVNARAQLREQDGTRFVDVTGTGTDLSLGQANADGALTGTTHLALQAEEKAGTLTIRKFDLNNDQMDATAQGVVGPQETDASAHLNIRNMGALGPGWRGSFTADARVQGTAGNGRVITLDGTGQDLSLGPARIAGALAGETVVTLRATERDGTVDIETATVSNPNLNAEAQGKVGSGTTDLTARLNTGNLGFLGRGFGGALRLNAHVEDRDGQRNITADGSASNLRVGSEQANRLLAGETTLTLRANQRDGRIRLEQLNARNPQLIVTANGAIDETGRRVTLDGRLGNLALLVPGFPGPVQVTGTLGERGNTYDVDLNAVAPGGTRIQVDGTAASDFSTTDLRIAGVSDAAVANPFLRTRSLQGPLNFDVTMRGKPGLQALAGRISLPNGRLADPKAGVTIDNLRLNVDLSDGRLQLDIAGSPSAGGQITVTGPVELSGNRDMDLRVNLNDVHLRDPNLYETRASGNLQVSGPQALGATISGRIQLDDTELRIPSTGLGGAKDIPNIEHIGDTQAIRATRAKAGLAAWPSPESRAAGMNSPAATPPKNPMKLDLTISAPNRVFVRGRGLDAELGGEIRLSGVTTKVVPIGALNLIRGRVDLLGKRFDLTEGLIELQGAMIPVIRFVATTEQDGITTTIEIDGEAADPEITFSSSPELPQEEVLSQLLFGRGLDTISPLQAAQLANAIAVLAGRGSEGIVGRLRSQVGLDDLDLATDENGDVSVRAGKYISDNIYTDIAVGADGKSEINLNLDITDSLKARGTIDSESDSSLGLYFERDY